MAAVGHLALYLAVTMAGLAALAGIRRAPFGRVVALTVALVVAVTAAGAALAWALVTSDFSLAYVATHSRREVAAPYRLAGLWGGMEGSLLLWVLALAIVTVVALHAARRAAGADAHTVVAVLAGTTGAFLLVIIGLADPFRTLAAPTLDGSGLTPILEHPAMLYHPPLLYAGLAATAAPFALTAAALLRGRVDEHWLAVCAHWMLVPWVLLAVGMVAGAHWAYAELGWGGFWAWDPVENTALLPWLAATAFLHARRRGDRALAGIAAPALALGAFLLAILGTMLTRSGAAPSVHAFAEDGAIGRALVGLLAVLVAGSVWLVLRPRARATREAFSAGNRPSQGRFLTRRGEGWLGVQVVLVGAVLVVVLAGTLEPLVASLRGGGDVAVAGRFFATFTAPLAVVLLAIVGFVTAPRLRAPLAAGVLGGAAALVAGGGWTEPFTIAVAAAGAFAATASLLAFVRAREGRGGHLAHLGFSLLLVGIAGSTTGHSVAETIGPGETIAVGGYEVRNDGVEAVSEPGAAVGRVAADVTLLRGGAELARFRPEVAVYPDLGIVLPESSLRSTPLEDVQVILRRADDSGRALFVVYVRPLVVWVWWGGLLLAAGGALAFIEAGRRSSLPASDPTVARSSPAEPRDVPAPFPSVLASAAGRARRVARRQASTAPAIASTGPPTPPTPPAV